MTEADREHEPQRPERIAGLYRALWRFATGKRGTFFASTVLLILSQVVKLGVPWVAAQAINAIQLEGAAALGRAGLLMGLVFLASVVAWLLHGPGRILERSVAIRVRETLSDRLYAKLARAPLAWHEARHSGETIHRVSQATHALFDFSQSQFIYLQNAVNLVGPLAALALLSPVVGVAAIAGYALIAAAIVRFDATMMRLAGEENQAERRFNAALVDYLGNIGTVIALRLEEATRRLLGARLAAVFRPLARSIVVNEAKWASVDLLATAVWTSLVVLYAWLASRGDGTLLLGNVFMVFQYAQQAGGVIGSLAANYQQLARVRADYASADPVWTAPERGAAPAPLPADWREIAIEGLDFTHPRARGERPTLASVALAIRRGESVALVGESGSGKSSLLRVLAGLYEPQTARVTVDGAGVELATVGAAATLVPQEAEVFEGTLAENLTLGEEVPRAALERAIHAAQLEPLVASLPQGLATPIAERGANFSGGQRQRIALARGLLAARGSSLLLLDEPTSALDPATEAAVYDAIFATFREAAVISSVHRVHLLPRFDRVVLMDAGQVVDSGTAEELAARQAAFRALVEHLRQEEAEENGG
ncbi:MAG: ABC transporter ATP-binding protein/permease [Burkholderiales bacterium]|nr:ABC transporter ATP-binding protein/permease [Burkholderiales bacterium]